MIIASTVISETVAIQMMICCHWGFGKHTSKLSKPIVDRTLELYFLAQILYKVGIGPTKVRDSKSQPSSSDLRRHPGIYSAVLPPGVQRIHMVQKALLVTPGHRGNNSRTSVVEYSRIGYTKTPR
jgi:hypothetical protein